jgi:hypothetical protein
MADKLKTLERENRELLKADLHGLADRPLDLPRDDRLINFTASLLDHGPSSPRMNPAQQPRSGREYDGFRYARRSGRRLRRHSTRPPRTAGARQSLPENLALRPGASWALLHGVVGHLALIPVPVRSSRDLIWLGNSFSERGWGLQTISRNVARYSRLRRQFLALKDARYGQLT